MKRFHAPLVALALAAAAVVATPASTSHMPVDEIRPGMEGYGVTVFQGTTREQFKVRILGVLENIMGPRRSLVLARLKGGPLAETGVIAGMSGSPVYVNGRLIGAISYSLGAFVKEPIAGITPIEEMLEATETRAPRPPAGRRAALELPLSGEQLERVLADSFARVQPFATRAEDVRGRLGAGLDAASLGLNLRPIATPVTLAGFSGEAQALLTRTMAASGLLLPISGSATVPAGAIDPDQPLQPGDAIGVSLVRGDLSLAATGTVTKVDGRRVYAFGHPFYNLGPTQFPMTRAYVHTLLPSLMSSVKVAAVGDVIGTVQQDRSTAIAGTLGPGPGLIPVSIALENDRGLRKQFRFEIANDQLLTPLLTFATIVNTLQSYEREFGVATFAVRGKAIVKDHGAITLEDIFTGEPPAIGAATYIVAPLAFLLRNDVAPVEIEAVDLTIEAAEQPRSATIERAWVDAVRIRPGQRVPLKVLTRSYRGEESVRTVDIEIPANASGTMTVLVTDGTRLAQWEQREWRRTQQPATIAQMIRVLNDTRRNNRLYVRLLSPDPGAVVNGEPLPALPPSVLSVMESDRHSGSFSSIRTAVAGAWDIPMPQAISGSRTLTLRIEEP